MKSLKGKLGEKLGRRRDPKPGSSTAPNTGTEDSEDARAVKAFLDQITTLAQGTGSTATSTWDEHVRDLARTIGPAVFTVSVTSSALRDEAQNFWVGAPDETGTNKVSFTLYEKQVFDPKFKIPLAVGVHTISADKLDISGSNGNLESFRFRREDYTSVDLAADESAGCLFVFTTQLSGCSFVIGCRESWLYMGHAQSDKGTAFAKNGDEVAASLKLKRETMFEGEENLESTFLVGAGSEFKIYELDGIITYNPGDPSDRSNPAHTLNVIGLVYHRKFYCILATKGRTFQNEIKNVALVTLETDATTGTRKWITEEMPKTW